MVFYIDCQELDKCKQIKKEFLAHKKVVDEFNFYWSYDLEGNAQELQEMSQKYG